MLMIDYSYRQCFYPIQWAMCVKLLSHAHPHESVISLVAQIHCRVDPPINIQHIVGAYTAKWILRLLSHHMPGH